MLATIFGAVENAVLTFSDFIWGGTWGETRVLPFGPMALILLGIGAFYMIRLGARPLRRFVPAIAEVWQGRKGNGDPNAITPFQALATALSGQVGTGNIVGVATAITIGGPGAVFWMWVTAILGMALAFAESSLAIKYREIDENGRINGGPMYYIRKGLGKKWTWLAAIFCLGTMFSATATGGMIQANGITANISDVFRTDFGLEVASAVSVLGVSIDPLKAIIGLIICGLVFAVIIGGIKSIGKVAGRLVPSMAALYILACLIILVLNIQHIPGAFAMIFASAFGLNQAVGGLAGYAVLFAVREGVARGLFSNEAGQGSAPIAHAASQMKNPASQGEIAMIGVFIDTMIVCTMTALVILTAEGSWATATQFREWAGDTTSHIWMAEGHSAATLTNQAFTDAVPGPVGGWVVTLCLTLFAFTTIIGWSYYAEQAVTFLIGEWATKPFRYIWVVVIFIGSVAQVHFVWRFGDIANASMALPNLLAILLLSGVVYRIHKANGDPDTADGNSVLDDLREKTPAE